MKQGFSIKSGQKLSEKIKMMSSLANLDLKILHREELQGLTVVIDEQELNSDQYLSIYEISQGKHRILITAKDREAIDKEIELSPGETGTLVVNLQYDRAPWKMALSSPHSDTKYGRQQIAFRIQSQSLRRAGAWSGDVSGFESYPLEKINAQTSKMNGFGLDLSFAWLIRRTRFEANAFGPNRI